MSKTPGQRRSFVTTELAVLCVVVLALSDRILCSVRSRPGPSSTYLQCPSQCSCLGNVVDCSKRTLTNVPTSLPDWVETLDLCSNAIRSVDTDAFEGLERLSEINLSDNPLESFNCSAFAQLPKLTEVKLAHCRLPNLPYCDAALNISHFSLNHNDIAELDSALLSSFLDLKSLDLSYNKIVQLNGSLFPFMPKLVHLFLNNNNVVALNRGVFDNLVSLEWLKLSKNRIQSLQKNTFAGLGQLKHLELERNRLRVIDGLVFHGLDNLLTLKLKRNAIAELMDGAFWRLNRIQTLDLGHNNISSISNKWLYGLETLLQLSLAHNQISQIAEDSWRFCRDLVQLDLNYNLLSSLSDKAFDKLESLQQLSISHNRLSVIADGSFTTLSAVHSLDISFNEISLGIEDKSGPFAHLTSLARLNLQHNRITSLSKPTFDGLTKLRLLQLSDNNVSSIQANAFESLTELQEFRLNSSQFICDCQLSWLKHWVDSAGFQSTVTAQCEYPESLRDKNVLDLAPTDFKCVNFPKPIVTNEPESQTAIKYGNVTLTCRAAAAAGSPLRIEWRKDNAVVTDSDVTTTVTGEAAEDMTEVMSLLQIWPVLDSHAGSYQCIASNALGTSYSSKAIVTVSVFPTFLKTPSNIVVKSGTTARLDCAATGSPQPEISLQKDGGDDFPAARERRMHIFPSDEMFFIVEIKTEDQGLYTCIAKNDVGVITANASLQVLEAPSFVKQMENKRTSSGETTVLECMTSGSPKPRLEWLKDGVPLRATLRHFFTADDQLLVIVQTERSDDGEYTCVMTNTLGSERQTSRLTVVPDGGGGVARPSVEDTTTGIIIIAVVCCVVGTSLVWVIVIYKTRQRRRQKGFGDDGESVGKRLTTAFGGRACHDESLSNIAIQGLYCPIQTSAFSNSDINGMKCRQHRRNPSSVFPSDTEDEEEEDDTEQRYSYCHPHRHDARLAEDQVCRQRTDSGTHTASSSLSSCVSNSRTVSEPPLQTFQSFVRGPVPPTANAAETVDSSSGQILAVIHLPSNLSSRHEKSKRVSSSSLVSTTKTTTTSQNTENSVQGELSAQSTTPLLLCKSELLQRAGPHLGKDSRGTALPSESIKDTSKEPFTGVTSDCVNVLTVVNLVPVEANS